MSCQVLLEMRVKEDCVDKLKSWFKSIITDTRDYDGCTSIYVVQNQDDPQNLVIVEQWETRQHYEAYLAWRTERGDMDAVGSMVEGEPSIRYFNYFGV